MIKRSFTLFSLIFLLLLEGCGNSFVNNPVLISDAENYTHDGLQAYSDAEWDSAQSLFSKSLSLYQGIDDQNGVLYSHINLAEVALSTLDYQAVEKHLQQAGQIAKKDLFKDAQARVTLLYSLSALKQNQLIRAEGLLNSLLPQFDGNQLIDKPNVIQLSALVNQTKIAFKNKKDESLWTDRLESALKRSAENSPDLEARLFRFQAKLLEQQGDFLNAENYLQRALISYKQNLSRSGIGMTLFTLGKLYMKQQRWLDAQDYLTRSAAVFRYLKNHEKLTIAHAELLVVDIKLKQKQF